MEYHSSYSYLHGIVLRIISVRTSYSKLILHDDIICIAFILEFEVFVSSKGKMIVERASW